MPDRSDELSDLEQQRAELYEELGDVGDFRRGSINEVWRKCGKANCACAAAGHPGHGPQYNFTRSVGGKTVNVHLKAGLELSKLEREVANHERFRALVGQVTEVNEAICDARPVSPLAEDGAEETTADEKGGFARRSRRTSPPRSPA